METYGSESFTGGILAILSIASFTLNLTLFLFARPRKPWTVDSYIITLCCFADLILSFWILFKLTILCLKISQFNHSWVIQLDGLIQIYFGCLSFSCVGGLAIVRSSVIFYQKSIPLITISIFILAPVCQILGLSLAIAIDFGFEKSSTYLLPNFNTYKYFDIGIITALSIAVYNIIYLLSIHLGYSLIFVRYWEILRLQASKMDTESQPSEITDFKLENSHFWSWFYLIFHFCLMLLLYNLVLWPAIISLIFPWAPMFGFSIIFSGVVNPITLVLLHDETRHHLIDFCTDLKSSLSHPY